MNISNIALFHRVPERADDDSFDRCADLDFILNIIMTSPIRSNKDSNFQKYSFFKKVFFNNNNTTNNIFCSSQLHYSCILSNLYCNSLRLLRRQQY